MDQVKYFQPYQQGDKITLQWLGHTDYVLGPTVAYVVRIVDCEGNIIKQQDATLGSAVGSLYIREVEMLLYDVPEGQYFVQIHKVGLVTDYDFFAISEGIEVKEYHPNTMLFRYSHTKNAYGIFWETGIEMWIRLHANFTEIQPGSKFNVYEDQPLNLTMLSGVKFRDKQLSFGVDTMPKPEFLIDRVEEILLCDTLYIDHQLHTRTEGSKIDLGRVDKNPLVTANIIMREKENNPDLIISQYEPIVIGAASESEWFYVGVLSQASPATSYPIRKYFNGAKNFVNYLNSANILGVVDYVNTYFALDASNRIVLITNDASVYADYQPGLSLTGVYEGHLVVEVDTTLGFDLVVAFTNASLTTKFAYFFGDGSAPTLGSGLTNNTAQTYASTGKKYTAHLFWDQIENLGLDSSEQIITAISGKLPQGTKTFNCENNQLRYIRNNIFASMGGDATAIQLAGSKLGKYAQNEVIRFAYESIGQFDATCGIDMQVQVPVTGPSVDAGTAFFRTKLLEAGVTVLTD